ncbi:hypothetical protein BB561_003719 [Smittium simulii]|uniref:U5 small nuclear ribonucleoprotein 200 kDa helicase n=1 Tax=Smittium simulii TaxID=133385 RepID=A0A2T9YJW1_9FUNG|nr:hypothetical protein BB561_003719 [Smittium simulii]
MTFFSLSDSLRAQDQRRTLSVNSLLADIDSKSSTHQPVNSIENTPKALTPPGNEYYTNEKNLLDFILEKIPTNISSIDSNPKLQDKHVDKPQLNCLKNSINNSSFNYFFEAIPLFLLNPRILEELANENKKSLQLDSVENKPLTFSYISKAVSQYKEIYSNEANSSELFNRIIEILCSNSEDIETELSDLIGFEHMDFLIDLVANRANIKEEYNFNQYSKELQKRVGSYNIPAISGTILSNSDIKNYKQLKAKSNSLKSKEVINENSELAFGAGLKEKRLKELSKNHNYQIAKASESQKTLKNVYTNQTSGRFFDQYGNKLALPSGSVSQNYVFYNEINIPPSKASKKFTVNPIHVNDMDFLCKNTFKGYKTLNPVQSIIYPTVYNTNENVLVCAPTGAGKTEVGMLAILKVISSYSKIDYESDSMEPKIKINKKDFKIVYVAPMKALASEIVRKYSDKLKWLGINVKEFTGDSQLTKREIASANIIVTTPEKWDVVTRKDSTSSDLVGLVRLLIIDEVHLLQDDRGIVLESIVARTFQTVESTQSLIRVIGLSATCPNYIDVAEFLKVNLQIGLFYFGPEYRPVPLDQYFIGIKDGSSFTQNLNQICYEKVLDNISKNENQVMVFVHTRKDTVKSALDLKNKADFNNDIDLFSCKNHPKYLTYYTQLSKKSKNKELLELIEYGFGIHHAGMLASDRRMVETMFSLGLIKVLCCTSTLSWGVNLPANSVIIKGTQIYSLQKGGFSDLSVLDVLQIFGRAGRPQFVNDYGTGIILTSQNKVNDYVQAVSSQSPIESMANKFIIDMLNAEIVLGTTTTLSEAVAWLGYTFLFIRMRKNPLAYGITNNELIADPNLLNYRQNIIKNAARELHKLQMIVFDANSEQLISKELGRIASTYYLSHRTIERFNAVLSGNMSDADLISIICMSNEFDQITLRQSESAELLNLLKNSTCCDIKGIGSNLEIHKIANDTKVNILLQAIISRAAINDFGLISDSIYISTNANRIIRAMFEMAISRNFCSTAINLLILGICVERKMWPFEHPLMQFDFPPHILSKLHLLSDGDVNNSSIIIRLRNLEPSELGQLVHNKSYGNTLYNTLSHFPLINVVSNKVVPITEFILQVELEFAADFEWSNRIHGGADMGSEKFYFFLEEVNTQEILYTDYFYINSKQQLLKFAFTIKMPQMIDPHLILRVLNDRWLGSDSSFSIKIDKLILPSNPGNIQTKLLDLNPLSIDIMQDKRITSMYRPKFSYFNPIQTQIFDTLFHSQENVMIGAPTGSGKTLAAELAMFAAFKKYPKKKVVYIAPLKALVKERVKDWGTRLKKHLGYKLVELSGDVTPDYLAILESDIIVTTPEKWDGISRRWISMDYVKQISLVIIDEIHLLGNDRGPILEVIVSRMNLISKITKIPTRILGLSTAVANATDIANWLDIKPTGLFNFSMSIRLVPLTIYIEKFGNKHYCPRMKSMNKPAFRCIKKMSPNKPVIIFVSSRRQTRITANELISFLGSESNPKMFLNMSNDELEVVLEKVSDANLAFALAFGIGLHHAGLTDSDRTLTEKLFEARKIQILVATSTLAWGVNLPAHLVIVKGTEFFDPKTHTYIDMPMTEVLQMIGRAGRPQFDTSATAVVYVYEPKFYYYKKFLFAKFPVESNLPKVLSDHLNAEINSTGYIDSMFSAMEYLCSTFLINRLKANPNYYGITESTSYGINAYLSKLVLESFAELEKSGCISFIEEKITREDDLNETEFPTLGGMVLEKSKEKRDNKHNIMVYPTLVGKVCSKYYISHLSLRIMNEKVPKVINLSADKMFDEALNLLCSMHEWVEIPVRHGEDDFNKQLNEFAPLKFPVHKTDFLDPKLKTNLLIQYHMSRMDLPCTDFITDSRTILDSSIRVLQALFDYAAIVVCDLNLALVLTKLQQCIKQACWKTDSGLQMFITSGVKMSTSKLLLLNKNQIIEFCGNNGLDSEIIEHGLGKLPILSTKIVKTRNSADYSYIELEVGIKFRDLKNKNLGEAYCPRFGKFQYEGYFVLVSEKKTNKVVKMLRLTNILEPKKKLQIKFVAPKNTELRLDIVSDCYLDIGQTLEFTL